MFRSLFVQVSNFNLSYVYIFLLKFCRFVYTHTNNGATSTVVDGVRFNHCDEVFLCEGCGSETTTPITENTQKFSLRRKISAQDERSDGPSYIFTHERTVACRRCMGAWGWVCMAPPLAQAENGGLEIKKIVPSRRVLCMYRKYILERGKPTDDERRRIRVFFFPGNRPVSWGRDASWWWGTQLPTC